MFSKSNRRGVDFRFPEFLVLVFVCFFFLWTAPAHAHSNPGRISTVECIVTGSKGHLFVKMSGAWLLKLLGRGDMTFEDMNQQEKKQVQKEVRALFDRGITVRVNGVTVQPVFQQFRRSNRALMVRTLTMIDYELELKQEPLTFSISWNLFQKPESERKRWGRGVRGRFVYDSGKKRTSSRILFTRNGTTFTWRKPGTASRETITPKTAIDPVKKIRLPVLSIVLLLLAPVFFLVFEVRHPFRRTGAILTVLVALILSPYVTWTITPPGTPPVDQPSENEAKQIFQTLHSNIYRAFDYKNRSDVYDTLRQSFSKPYLEQMFLKLVPSIVPSGSGNTNTDIMNVKRLDQTVYPDRKNANTFRVNCRWRVSGTISHRGHSHSRTNEYRAIFTVTNNGKTWKISGAEVKTHVRITKKG